MNKQWPPFGGALLIEDELYYTQRVLNRRWATKCVTDDVGPVSSLSN